MIYGLLLSVRVGPVLLMRLAEQAGVGVEEMRI